MTDIPYYNWEVLFDQYDWLYYQEIIIYVRGYPRIIKIPYWNAET